MIAEDTDPRYEVGVPLDLYPGDLPRVPDEHDLHPAGSFDPFEAAGPGVREYVDAYHDPSFSFMDVAHALPLAVYERLSVAQRQMIRSSTDTTFASEEVRTLLEEDPRHEIMYKISNSMWKWGHGRAGWNERVDAYDGIRTFDLGVPGFDVLLDRTCWFHSRGHSKYAGVFLDGSFGFHVMHAGRRVMTIGFSIAGGRRVLVSQIQVASRKGNRWMFRFPSDRIATIIAAFQRSFPRHSVHLVDGFDASRRILDDYAKRIRTLEDAIATYREYVARGSTIWSDADIARAEEEIRIVRGRIAHLTGDAPRLAAFYGGSGSLRLGDELTANGLRHREVLPLAA